MRVLFFAFVLALLPINGAWADLRFSPQRIIMGDRVNSASLTLTNSGSRERSYRIELVDVIYSDDGRVTIVEAAPEGYPTARPYLRFSPSQVRLGPGESQRVRVITKTRDIPDGEFRVHARIISIASPSEAAAALGGEVQSGVFALSHAVALPVILRRGPTSADGSVSDVAFEDGRQRLSVLLSRSGDQSLYVDLRLRRGSETGEIVSVTKGVSVPVPNKNRRVWMPFDEAAPQGDYTLEVVDNATGAVIATARTR